MQLCNVKNMGGLNHSFDFLVTALDMLLPSSVLLYEPSGSNRFIAGLWLNVTHGLSANTLASAAALTVISYRQWDTRQLQQNSVISSLGRKLFHHLSWSKDAMTASAWSCQYRNSHSVWGTASDFVVTSPQISQIKLSVGLTYQCTECLYKPPMHFASWYLFIIVVIIIYLLLISFDRKPEGCDGLSNCLLHGIVVGLFVETTRYRSGMTKLAWCPAKWVKGLMHLNSPCWNRYSR